MSYCRLPSLLLVALFFAGCAGVPLYPPRPPALPGQPIADPAPSKVVVHVAATSEGLSKAFDDALPLNGSSTFNLGGPRIWSWRRTPVAFRFAGGKLCALATVLVGADLPVLGVQSLSLNLKICGEPVVGTDYKARLQSPQVELTPSDMKARVAEAYGGIKMLSEEIRGYIEGYAYDLSPRILDAYARLASPIDLPLGDAHGCLALRVTGVEAGPTVLAGGIEKDLALVVAPSVTLPCAPPALPPAPAPLANVTSLPSGPFTVTVPIAASYAELAKAMTLAFTDGKLFFSKEYPELYLSNPEIYAAQGVLVLKLRLGGPVKAGFIKTDLDGDIYFSGHPAVIDNELQIPDLQPTVETSSFLLKLKAKLDGDSMRDQARQALRLDLGERLAEARGKVSGDRQVGPGCLRSDVSKIEVTGVYPHASYLRIYVAVTAQASVFLPCPTPLPELPVAREP